MDPKHPYRDKEDFKETKRAFVEKVKAFIDNHRASGGYIDPLTEDDIQRIAFLVCYSDRSDTNLPERIRNVFSRTSPKIQFIENPNCTIQNLQGAAPSVQEQASSQSPQNFIPGTIPSTSGLQRSIGLTTNQSAIYTTPGPPSFNLDISDMEETNLSENERAFKRQPTERYEEEHMSSSSSCGSPDSISQHLKSIKEIVKLKRTANLQRASAPSAQKLPVQTPPQAPTQSPRKFIQGTLPSTSQGLQSPIRKKKTNPSAIHTTPENEGTSSDLRRKEEMKRKRESPERLEEQHAASSSSRGSFDSISEHLKCIREKIKLRRSADLQRASTPSVDDLRGLFHQTPGRTSTEASREFNQGTKPSTSQGVQGSIGKKKKKIAINTTPGRDLQKLPVQTPAQASTQSSSKSIQGTKRSTSQGMHFSIGKKSYRSTINTTPGIAKFLQQHYGNATDSTSLQCFLSVLCYLGRRNPFTSNKYAGLYWEKRNRSAICTAPGRDLQGALAPSAQKLPLQTPAQASTQSPPTFIEGTLPSTSRGLQGSISKKRNQSEIPGENKKRQKKSRIPRVTKGDLAIALLKIERKQRKLSDDFGKYKMMVEDFLNSDDDDSSTSDD